jgi:dTMP kinase
MERGLFIVLEGLDNSGKTTQSDRQKKRLESLDIPVVQTREPGGTVVGEEIRAVLLRPDRPKSIYPLAQALLFNAARVEFLNDVVLPNLDKGITVISDRFDASTFAYQGYGEGVSPKILDFLYQEVVGVTGVKPDIYAILDVTVEESRRRLENPDNVGQVWAYEQKGPDFAERVRDGYLSYASKPGVICIDGMNDRGLITEKLSSIIDEALIERGLLHV